MSGTYTYLACDLISNAVLAELPLSQVTYQTLLNSAGTFSAKLPLMDARVKRLDPVATTQPTRTALYIDRDGVLVWGGIIWTRRYDSPSNSFALAGTEFWSYFKHRFLHTTLDYPAPGTDEFIIVRDLINYAQFQGGGNIGIQVGSNTSGILRTLTHWLYEKKNIADEIERLAKLDNGFDFGIDVSYVGGIPTKTLNLAYPRRGRAQGATGHVFEYPGNIISYVWPEDGTTQAVSATIVGAGEGTSMLTSTSVNTSMIDAGYPLVEEKFTYKEMTDPAAVASMAASLVRAYATPITLPQLTVRADVDPVLGAYIDGDDVRVRITDAARFPDNRGVANTDGIDHSFDGYFEITGKEVTPTDDTKEVVLLTLGVPRI